MAVVPEGKDAAAHQEKEHLSDPLKKDPPNRTNQITETHTGIVMAEHF